MIKDILRDPLTYVCIGLPVILWGMMFTVSFGQDIREHHEHQSVAGRFYASWLQPNFGRPRQASCCNHKDCYQTRIQQVGAHWFALRREDGAWIAIPDHRLEHNQGDALDSPDGLSHVCMAAPTSGNQVYCAVLGSQG
jgi:hypothetical protein